MLGYEHVGEGYGERRTNVPSLRDEYSDEEDHQEPSGSNPSVGSIGSRFVEPCLVLLESLSTTISTRPKSHTIIYVSALRLTLENLEVCALTAAKGVCSGSIESMVTTFLV